jgi:two-component sensor histidine kinase
LETLSERVRAHVAGPYIFALAMVGLALVGRVVFGWLGASLPYATFYPAILFAALVAGPHAAIAAMVVSVALVGWMLLPPFMHGGPLSATTIANHGLFVVVTGLMIWLAHVFRQAITRLRTEERHRELMLKEMEHRGKNTFAVVEAIVRNTLGMTDDSETIVGRVRSVSSTNDIINRSPTHRASLQSIIANEFEAYGPDRVRCNGPDIDLSPHASRHVALVLHELVTNAVKHGALSTPQGYVAVEWEADGSMVTMRWAEREGPAAVTPEAYGFGARLVTSTLKALGGGIDAEFSERGLTCRITFRQS